MIKFFRKIRQNLLMENKTEKPALPVGRYLKYAVGEIILVVIGILIALSINNWNEERKSDKQIQLLMNSLVEAIKEDIRYLNYTANLHEFRSISLKYLLNFSRNTIDTSSTINSIPKLENYTIWEGAYPDTLNADFVNKSIQWSGTNDNLVIDKNVLDELKNSNLFSAIRNDSLKRVINSYYSYLNSNFLLDDWNEELTFSWRVFLRDNYGVLTRSLYGMDDDPLEFLKRNEAVQVRVQEMIGPARFRSTKAIKAIALAEDVIREINKYQKSK